MKRNGEMKSVSAIGNIVSAIKYLYLSKNVTMNPKIANSLNTYLKGANRQRHKGVANGTLPDEYGDAPLQYDEFHALLLQTLKSGNNFSLSAFCHVFILLCYSLLARGESVSRLKTENICIENDHININIGKSKSDPTSARDYPRAVYSNPLDPVMDVYLALGIYIFTQERDMNGRFLDFLFGVTPKHSNAATSKVTNWIKSICEKAKTLDDNRAASNELFRIAQQLGDKKGLHSCRKTSATYASAVPSIQTLAICLRACWSVGILKRYVYQSKHNDECIGRAITGIDHGTREYSVLPAHFSNTDMLTHEFYKVIISTLCCYHMFS
ncbi:MAG TPA: hypothetical protein VHD33_07555 [Legionellaceae bacterium]|nr:hypothetical protein [Legionellaceae bacterium]